MVNHCQAPNCDKIAVMRRKFLDPRRSHDVICEYVDRFYCSPGCEEAIAYELERESYIARRVK